MIRFNEICSNKEFAQELYDNKKRLELKYCGLTVQELFELFKLLQEKEE